MTIAVLTETELKQLVQINEAALEAIEDGFMALARGAAVMPPILRLDVKEHNGEMDVKTAYVAGLDHFALKVSCGFFNNPSLGLPSLGGLMNLMNAKTGQVEAVLLDNGYLTDIRTALAGAVAARYLSRKNAKKAGIMGTGLQARLQAQALELVRDVEDFLIWGRDPDKAGECAADIANATGKPARVIEEAEKLVRNSDIVITTTPSETPLIEASWVHEGLHITAMGSDAEHKNELDPQIIPDADLYVCDRQSQCTVLGELHHAIAKDLVDENQTFSELGHIILGEDPGRGDDRQVTVCDLTGTGVQDTAIATYAYKLASESHVGRKIVA